MTAERDGTCPYHSTIANGMRRFGPRHPCFTVYDIPPGNADCLQGVWYRGLTCDHLYPNCPNLLRGEKELRRAGWWDADEPMRGPIYPHGGDICGVCLHRHNRTTHKAEVAS